MELKELRIGNWVYDEEGICSKIIGVCDELGEDSVLIEWHPQGKPPSIECIMDANLLMPIPLSEELLLKCGFEMELSVSTSIFICKQRRDLIVQYIPEICSYIFRIKSGMGYSTFVRYIDYLHQLQNLLFAITDEGLEVELWSD